MRVFVGLAVATGAALVSSCGSCWWERPGCEDVSCPPQRECDPATGECEVIRCEAGTRRCSPTDPGAVDVCRVPSGDAWDPLARCSTEQTCVATAMGGGCSPAECDEGETACEPDGRVRRCIAGAMQPAEVCPEGEVCDATMASACIPSVCPAGETFCEGKTVLRLCNALGTDSELVASCEGGDRCQGGGCISLCGLADWGSRFVGCVYFALDTNNSAYDDPLPFEVMLANENATLIADVVVEVRAPAGGAWLPIATTSLAPGTTGTIVLPDRHVEGSAFAPALAYRVTSSVPVVAWQINSDDPGGASASSGGSHLRAAPSLGRTVRAMSLPSSSGSDALVDFGAEVHSSGFAVVATSDSTSVTVTASTPTMAGPGLPALAVGESWTMLLAEGDVLQIEAAAIGDDVTGSEISADAAVAVFGYHECATIDPGSCDHIEEQLPDERIGTPDWVVRPHLEGNTMLVRVLAAWTDDTVFTYEYGPGVSGVPAAASGTILLELGELYEFALAGPAVAPGEAGDAALMLSSTDGIRVAVFTTGEPSMVIPLGWDQWSSRYHVATLPSFDAGVTVVRRPWQEVILDGAPLATPWTVLSFEWPGWETTHTSLASGAHALGIPGPRDWKTGIGLLIAGEGASASYAFVGRVYTSDICGVVSCIPVDE